MNRSFEAEPDIRSEDIVLALFEENHITAPPTDAELIASYLRLKIVEFDEDAKLDSQILAYLWPERHQIGVLKTLPPRRRTFSILHEIGHYVLPGHLALVERFQDTDTDFGSRTLNTLEREANQFAADCLFQLDRFDQKIFGLTLTWTNIVLCADEYLASYEATARRWIERTPEECALIVLKPVVRQPVGSDLEIMYTVASKSFKTRYFSALTPGQTIGTDSLAYRVFYHLEYSENPEEPLIVQMPGKEWRFRVMLFSNSYRMLGLIVPSEM